MNIFSAMSDPTKRIIIMRLADGERKSIKALNKDMAISRQGLTKHLDKLIQSKILQSEYVGKERVHFIHPKSKASLVHRVKPFSEQWNEKLHRLSVLIGGSHE